MIDEQASGKGLRRRWGLRLGVLGLVAVSASLGLSHDTRQVSGEATARPGAAPASAARGGAGPATRFVKKEGGALYEAPGDAGGIRLAGLHGGTPVRMAEQRGEWVRVVLWGWVRLADLDAEGPTEVWEVPGPKPGSGARPSPTGTEKAAAGTGATESDGPARVDLVLEPELDEAGRPIVDATKATRITVVTYPEAASAAGGAEKGGSEDSRPARTAGLGVSVGLIDLHGRLVAWETGPLEFGLTLWEKRPAPGGYVRGRKLYVGTVTLANWKEGVFAASRKCRIEYSALDLEGVPAKQGILVVHTRLPDGRVIFGRDYQVSVEAPSGR